MTELSNEPQAAPLLNLIAPGRDRLRLSLSLRERDSQQAFEALPEPFVKIGETHFSHLFLGRIENADGLLTQQVVVKIQKDRPVGLSADLTNSAANKALKLELQSLNLFSHKHAAPLVKPFMHQRGETVPPVFFCKRVQQYFHPLCPECGAQLRDCKDDKLLQSAGLPEYGNSQKRFLYCGQCSHEASGAVFYSQHSDTQGQSKVLDRWQLVQAFPNLFNKKDLASPFPCQHCQYQSQCYQSGQSRIEASRLLVPLSFHDFHVSVHEWMPLRYDEVMDLLGGRSWQNVLDDLKQSYELDRLAVLEKQRPLELFDGFIASAEPDRLIMEVAYGKLSVFQQLIRAAGLVQKGLKRPIFDLNPNKIWIDIGDNDQIPVYWNVRLRLANLDNVVASRQGTDLTPVFSQAATAYMHPIVQDTAGGGFNTGRLTITQLNPLKGTEFILQAALDTAHWGRVEQGFRQVQLVLGREHGFQAEFNLEADIVNRQGGRLVIQSQSKVTTPEDLDQLQAIASIPGVEVYYRPLRRYDQSIDYYSLGLLLCRALLVNNKQSLETLRNQIDGVSRQWREGGEKRREILAQMEQDPLWHPAHVFWEPRTKAYLFRQLWQPIIELVLDLVTADGDQDMENFIKRTEVITGAFRQALFSETAAMHEDIRHVLLETINDTDWIKDLGLQTLPAATPPEPQSYAQPEPPAARTPATTPPITSDRQPMAPPRTGAPRQSSQDAQTWNAKEDENESGREEKWNLPHMPEEMMEQTIMMAGGMASERTDSRKDRDTDDEDVSDDIFSSLEKTIQQKFDETTDSTSSTPPFNSELTMDRTWGGRLDSQFNPVTPKAEKPRTNERKPPKTPRQPPPGRDFGHSTTGMDPTMIIRKDKPSPTFDDSQTIDESPDPGRKMPDNTPPPMDNGDFSDFDQTVVIRKGDMSLDAPDTADEKPRLLDDSFDNPPTSPPHYELPPTGHDDDDDDEDDMDTTIIIRPDK